MAWHRIRHKATGETQIVASLDGYGDEWEAVKLKANRAPSEFQRVNDDGSATLDTAARDNALRRQPLAKLTHAELLDLILKMQDDIAALMRGEA